MTYILLYIAALIAAMVGVGVVVARQPRVNSSKEINKDEEWLFAESTLSDPCYSGLTSNIWHIDHRD